uniref:Gem-associated protein 6 Sm-like domain-containing protein n=1 Tax=Nothoprocta perdicaria TaxID=30464 RepID=A0A8C6ZL36_NOTPE
MNDWQRKSPLDWQGYVDKQVKVAAAEKHEYEGWVLTVDPVSANLLGIKIACRGSVPVLLYIIIIFN